MKKAYYNCRRCQHVWFEVPAEKAKVARMGADPCPNCGHLYALWLNYEQDFSNDRIRGQHEGTIRKNDHVPHDS